MSTGPVQSGFQGVRQLPVYLWQKWKVQHLAVKGSAYVLLALAGAGVIYFIAQRLFSNAPDAGRKRPDSQALRGQRKFTMNDVVDVVPNKTSQRPFCWYFHFFGPNLDALVLPNFENYSQGIFHFELRDVLDASNIDSNGNSRVPLKVSFAYEGEEFFTQEIAAGESNANLFLQNLPYGKEVTVRFTAGTLVKEARFPVNQVRGLYQIDQHLAPSSQPLKEAVFLSPSAQPMANVFERYHEFSRQPLGLSLGDMRCNPFNPTGNNPYLTLKNEVDGFQVLALQFETSGSGRNPQNHRLSLTVVLDPKDTKNLTEQVIRNHVIEAYKKARKTVPQSLKINLRSLQQIIYTN